MEKSFYINYREKEIYNFVIYDFFNIVMVSTMVGKL